MPLKKSPIATVLAQRTRNIHSSARTTRSGRTFARIKRLLEEDTIVTRSQRANYILNGTHNGTAQGSGNPPRADNDELLSTTERHNLSASFSTFVPVNQKQNPQELPPSKRARLLPSSSVTQIVSSHPRVDTQPVRSGPAPKSSVNNPCYRECENRIVPRVRQTTRAAPLSGLPETATQPSTPSQHPAVGTESVTGQINPSNSSQPSLFTQLSETVTGIFDQIERGIDTFQNYVGNPVLYHLGISTHEATTTNSVSTVSTVPAIVEPVQTAVTRPAQHVIAPPPIITTGLRDTNVPVERRQNPPRSCRVRTYSSDFRVRKVPAKQQWLELNSVPYFYTESLAIPGQEAETEKCCICFNQFEQQDAVRRLKCLHLFHNGCIENWIWKTKRCPICNTNFTNAWIL